MKKIEITIHTSSAYFSYSLGGGDPVAIAMQLDREITRNSTLVCRGSGEDMGQVFVIKTEFIEAVEVREAGEDGDGGAGEG